MAYPSTIDTFGGTAAQGTTLLASVDHALDHRSLGSAVGNIETTLGTNSGTSVLKNMTVGNFAARINNETFGSPTVNGGTLGTVTINASTIGTPAITGGTGNAMTLGTPIIGTISVPGTIAALSFGAAIAPDIGTITDSAGGTLTVNAQAGQIYYSAMGTSAGNRTIGTPLNPTNYQQLTYAFKASGSANGTLVWASVFRISQDLGTPTLGTGTSWNYFNWRYNAIDSKWDFIGQVLNLV